MGRTKKLIDFKPLKSVTYHKELHHTCLNPAICKLRISPSRACRNCKFYKNQAVEVADNPIRHDIRDWY